MAVLLQNQFMSRVYLNSNAVEANSLAPQRVGAIWQRFSKQTSDANPAPLLAELCVAETDLLARETLLPLMAKAIEPNVVITPSEDDTGVFYLSQDGARFAVFKAGEKRARTELLARHIAHKIGLERHAIPGVFCTIANPVFPRDGIELELWNGNVKVYETDTEEVLGQNEHLETPYTLTGILEPYIDVDPKICIEEFASMTLFALFIGLRDGKLDGMKGVMLIDLEEIMPLRLLPDSSPDKHVAATHLPFLQHRLANDIIPLETLEVLLKKIGEVDLFPFLSKLSEERVLFYDSASETFNPLDEENRDGWDHGGCFVRVEELESTITPPTIDVEQTTRLLNDSELSACTERVARLKEFLSESIQKKKLVTVLDMVRYVDPLYAAHLDALSENGSDRVSHTSIAGRFTPEDSGVPFDDDMRNLLAEAAIKRGYSDLARNLFPDSDSKDNTEN